jgi:cytochrome c556
MKKFSLTSVALIALALGIAGLGRAVADDSADNSSGDQGQHWHHHGDWGNVLTADEKAELKKDFEQVNSSNPDLKTEDESLRQEGKALHENKDATADDKKAFWEKMKAHHEKVEAAVEAIDSNASAIFAKLKAAHHHHHDNGGSSDSGSNT